MRDLLDEVQERILGLRHDRRMMHTQAVIAPTTS